MAASENAFGKRPAGETPSRRTGWQKYVYVVTHIVTINKWDAEIDAENRRSGGAREQERERERGREGCEHGPGTFEIRALFEAFAILAWFIFSICSD